jgi:curved DNA-binding protein CbpA
MGTEESIFSIMCYTHSDLINYFEIESNGLFGKFFEDLKNNELVVKSEGFKEVVISNLDINKVGLYVITFNSPNQFETLVQSMLEYDKDFIIKPKKFLLNNSTDLSTTPRYQELCEEYGFEHIKKDNIGIVGGRVFVAEHFNETDLDFYYWFEDDMSFHPKKGEVCKNGFNRFVPNLYSKTLSIMIPPGTQPETVMSCRGEGLPNMRSRSRGNLLIKIKVEIPKKLSEEQKLLIEKISNNGI